MNRPSLLTVFSAGLSDDELAVLNRVFVSIAEKGPRYRDIGQRRAEAQVLVVNGDTLEGREALVQSTGEGNQQIKLVLSRGVIEGPNIIWMIKPLSFDVLAGILFRVSKDIDKKITGQSTLRKSTFHLLYEAKLQGYMIALSLQGLPRLYVNGLGNLGASECSNEQLMRVLASDAAELSIEDVLITDIPAVTSGLMTVVPLDNLLWQAGLMWDTGELLSELYIDQVFSLKEWPNFSVNNVFPEHLQLVSALSNRPLSVAQLHELTGIASKEVTCFINAAYAVGLLGAAGARSELEEGAVEVATEQPKSLFSRLKARVSFVS